MAEGRQRAEWLRVGIQTAWLVNRNGWTREPIDPLRVIPPQFRPPREERPEKTAEQIEDESRRAWHVLDGVFGRA